ncbi:hypothetical protein IWQ61_003142 [Dispira simplex]|nr:hypothetical protein IWQ61_003142 [Dispira simplex]
MRVNVASTITHWLLLPVICFLLIQFSSGQVTIFNSTEASQNQTFLSYDFDGYPESFYEVTGVAVALDIGPKCDWTSHVKPWQPPVVTPTTIIGPPNVTVLVVDRDNMLQGGCQSYKQVFQGIESLNTTLGQMGYPSIRVLLLGAALNEKNHFGNSVLEGFFDFSNSKPDSVVAALVGRDVGARLWNRSRNTGTYYVTVEQVRTGTFNLSAFIMTTVVILTICIQDSNRVQSNGQVTVQDPLSPISTATAVSPVYSNAKAGEWLPTPSEKHDSYLHGPPSSLGTTVVLSSMDVGPQLVQSPLPREWARRNIMAHPDEPIPPPRQTEIYSNRPSLWFASSPLYTGKINYGG